MAILKIRDAEGNVQEILAIKGNDGKNGVDGKNGIDGKNGSDYVLTEADKREIAEMAAQLVTAAMPVSEDIPSGEEVSY